MKIAVVVTKSGKFVPFYGVWTDPGDAFRSICENSEHSNKALKKHDVAIFDLKDLEPAKVLLGVESEYYEDLGADE